MESEIDHRLREPRDDEERELMDPDTWDWSSLKELPPVQNPAAILPIRFSLEEMTRVGRAAEAEGPTIYEYIKQSALMRVLHEAPN
jgi:hypothetical protein